MVRSGRPPRLPGASQADLWPSPELPRARLGTGLPPPATGRRALPLAWRSSAPGRRRRARPALARVWTSNQADGGDYERHVEAVANQADRPDSPEALFPCPLAEALIARSGRRRREAAAPAPDDRHRPLAPGVEQLVGHAFGGGGATLPLGEALEALDFHGGATGDQIRRPCPASFSHGPHLVPFGRQHTGHGQLFVAGTSDRLVETSAHRGGVTTGPYPLRPTGAPEGPIRSCRPAATQGLCPAPVHLASSGWESGRSRSITSSDGR
jgi:hypothetical protein